MMTKILSSPSELKKAFPFFAHHQDLVYLDTAATSQKPLCVIEAMHDFMARFNAPIHRAAYKQSYIATQMYEEARQTIAAFIGSSSEHLVFTKGTTEGLNLVASGLKKQIKKDDEILVLETEHHANLLPWQQLVKETGAKLIKIPVLDTGHIDFLAFSALLNSQVKIIALAHMSNVTGAVQDIKKVSELVSATEAFLIVDGAQGICHQRINLQDLNIDAYAFSSHKLYGPTGLGILHLSQRLLDRLDLYQVGGDVIESVSFDQTIYKKDRSRFEAGTPMVTEVIGFEKALLFLQSLDLEHVYLQEKRHVEHIKAALKDMPGIQLIGSSDTGLVSFYADQVHALDIATYCDSQKVALRSGHLCAQPCLTRFHTSQAVRISLGIYTTDEDVDKGLRAIEAAVLFFS